MSTSTFGPGTYGGASYVFDFADVPKAAFYRVQQSGNRGILDYSHSDMVDNNWVVQLTLGDG